MKVRKSTCGLCKPSKKWKKNNTRLRNMFNRAFEEGELTSNLTSNLINAYTKTAL